MRRLGMALVTGAISATALLGASGIAHAFYLAGHGATKDASRTDLQKSLFDACPNGGTALEITYRWTGTEWLAESDQVTCF